MEQSLDVDDELAARRKLARICEEESEESELYPAMFEVDLTIAQDRESKEKLELEIGEVRERWRDTNADRTDAFRGC